MSLYNLWWYDCPSNQFQHSLSLQLQGLNSHLIWIDFFGNLSSWLRVPLHTNTESRPFSSPFTSFCEIITFLTPGFFSWGQIALIQSTFPCSSVLLDLPVLLCFSQLSHVSSKYSVQTWPSAPALILPMLKGEEGPLCMSCKDKGTDSKREKTSPLQLGTCEHMHTVESQVHA